MKWMYYVQTIKPESGLYPHRHEFNNDELVYRKQYRGTVIQMYSKNAKKWIYTSDGWDFYKVIIAGENEHYHWKRISEGEMVLEFL